MPALAADSRPRRFARIKVTSRRHATGNRSANNKNSGGYPLIIHNQNYQLLPVLPLEGLK
jgi:hypothetical protein